MTAPESPAEVLRRAAAKLRGQAEAAKELTGDGNGGWFPWGTVRNTKWQAFPEPREVPAAPYPFGDGGTEMAEGEHVPTGEAFVACSRYAHDQEEDWHEPEFFAGPMPEALAEYIANVHPGVGLTVAALLEREAALLDAALEFCVTCGNHVTACPCPGTPLAIARAVLGEGETP